MPCPGILKGEKMDEFVSKEAVLEILCKNCTENCTGGTPYRCYIPCAEWKLIQALPAADVKPVVRGEWISVPHKRARICSHCECDEPYKFAENDADVYNFCPNCGADMRKEAKQNE